MENGDLERIVKEDIRVCIGMLEEYLGISGVKMPRVVLAEEGYSFQDSRNNLIAILKEDVGNGNTYFEETGHLCRHHLHRWHEKIAARFKGGWYVDCEEFFGMLSREIGKQKTKGTEYEKWFSDKNRGKSWMDPSMLKMFKAHANSYEDFQNFAIEGVKSHEEFNKKRFLLLRDISGSIHDYLISNLYKRGMTPEELSRNCLDQLANFLNWSVKVEPHFLFERDDLMELHFKFIKELTQYSKSLAKNPPVRPVTVSQLPGHETYIQIAESDVYDPRFENKTVVQARQEMIDKIGHYPGYIAAEIFLSNNRLTPETAREMYRLTDKEVRKRFLYIPEVTRRVKEVKEILGVD